MPYAGYGDRFLASLVDGLIMMGWIVVAGGLGRVLVLIITLLLGSIPVLQALVSIAALLAILGGVLAMFIIGEGGPLGQTPGKHLLGIKVVGAQPGPIGYKSGASRNLVRFLYASVGTALCCGIPILGTLGFGWALFDGERRTWHDLAANTRVVTAASNERSLKYWWHSFRIKSQ